MPSRRRFWRRCASIRTFRTPRSAAASAVARKPCTISTSSFLPSTPRRSSNLLFSFPSSWASSPKAPPKPACTPRTACSAISALSPARNSPSRWCTLPAARSTTSSSASVPWRAAGPSMSMPSPPCRIMPMRPSSRPCTMKPSSTARWISTSLTPNCARTKARSRPQSTVVCRTSSSSRICAASSTITPPPATAAQLSARWPMQPTNWACSTSASPTTASPPSRPMASMKSASSYRSRRSKR